jgi:hypothetical protein
VEVRLPENGSNHQHRHREQRITVMFWFFQKAPNCLFECHVKVRHGKNVAMPSHVLGAFVTCFAAAPDYQSALKNAVSVLASQGYIFEDVMDGKVSQLDPSTWDDYVARTWPECPRHFPLQSDMKRFIKSGGVFFGPFVCWESE